MSMMMRRGMMVPKAPGGLPSEYLQVQYLQAPSGQYIVTNLYPDLTMSYEAEVEHNKAGDQYLAGGRVGASSPIGGIGYYNQHFQSCYMAYLYTGDVVSGKAIYRIDMSNGSQTGYINGIQSGTCDRTIPRTGDYSPISIFGLTKSSGGIDNPFTGKCYWLKIYINNALAGHFIPCIRIADSKPGMYDLVGRQFYTNQGTGEFIAGWTLLPEQDGRVEKAKLPLYSGAHIHMEWDNTKLSDRTADTVISFHKQINTWNIMNPNPAASGYLIVSGSINTTIYRGGYIDFDVPADVNLLVGYWEDSDTSDRRITGDYVNIQIS